MSSRTRRSVGANDTSGAILMTSGAAPKVMDPAPAIAPSNTSALMSGRRKTQKGMTYIR
jgi:hypothetical protein